ncbi:M16 family metallopeptidase [Maritimibacter fusiformis]|uniref:Insulinase family protein n=1 Tax=Maritimibacter fusiformis TaxID=2603819 RepID=A0A5D0R9J4_9RHOB|nr:pitrilysin family protein [Maritimibacter fusiformis]TYB77561.1 insulinase family protein [Maritimibacter fusiformis]
MKHLLLVLFCLIALPARAEVEIQEITSPGGIDAWLVEEHSIPFVALELRFRGGASLDAPGKRGAINLMTGLLEEGAGEMDARAFAEAREALAASYRFNVGDDSLSVSARFLTENRDAAVDLLRLALVEPRFDADAVERVRAQVMSSLKSRETDPDAIASDTFNRLAYGDHPYGSYYAGTLDSVAALTRDDVVAAKARVLARDRVYVAAVGDIDAEALGALIDEVLGGLPDTGAPMPQDTSFAATPGVTVVEFGSPQSVAMFGHDGIGIDDPDFFAAFILNTIFGGSGFNSRLMDEVREKRGLTYGIRTYLIDGDHAKAMLGMVSTVNPRMAETIAVVRDEWARIARDGITAEELAKAKTYLTGAYPLRFDGNAPIARILVGMQMDGYPTSYVATRNDRIEAVTLDEANRVAARIYRPDELRFVVVGQPEGVEATE